MKYEFISADNHLDSRWLPRNLWQDRVAAKFKDRAPKIVEHAEKGSIWTWEDGTFGMPAADGSNNRSLQEKFFPGIDLKPGELPPSDAKLIIRHMDMAKIYAGVFYSDTRKWLVRDPALHLEIYRAYNDFVLDELNGHDRDRIIVLPVLPTGLPDACPAELERVLKKGAKAVEFGVFDVAQPIYDPVWEPIWKGAADAGIPICAHIGDKAGTPYPPNTFGSSLAHFSVTPFVLAKPIAQFVFCGALERHPTLNLSFAECRIGWLPFLISWMDRQVRERPADPTAKLSMLPCEYIKRSVTFTFEEDHVGVNLIPFDWAKLKDSVIWGSDYPHEQGTWPNAEDAIASMFKGIDIDPKVKREIVFDHAARVFKIEGGRS